MYLCVYNVRLVHLVLQKSLNIYATSYRAKEVYVQFIKSAIYFIEPIISIFSNG